ncbi:MAG: DinB family protein [Planctomycetaceae bacterium]|nr:DinB family protein [Planctomycetaceae bacterium]
MNDQQSLREHVTYLLNGGGAHLNFDAAVADLPDEFRGRKPDTLPHTAWELAEHMRLCQWDILEYCRDPEHVSPDFPEGYWPESPAPTDEAAWDHTLGRFRQDLESMKELVNNPDHDLLAPLPHGQNGHTILREALLIVDHNAYHLGQLVFVRKALGIW